MNAYGGVDTMTDLGNTVNTAASRGNASKPSLRENMILQRGNYVKPMTATAATHKNRRVFSGNDSKQDASNPNGTNTTTNIGFNLNGRARNAVAAQSFDKFGAKRAANQRLRSSN
jgi:hypothetical protein